MKYDVRTESWIPVRTLSGEKKVLGMEALFREAPQLEGLDGLDVMVEYSLYRFLTVFLMAAYKPALWDDKYDILEQGSFDIDVLNKYIQHCMDHEVSFDLFDSKRPFLQAFADPAYDDDKTGIKSVACLDNTRASGNNPIHFDHHLEEEVSFTPAQALRGLLAAQFFCTAMSGGYPSNVNGAPPLFFLPKGENLFETLVLAMVSADPQNMGTPLWESEREIVPREEVTAASLLYGMLFPSRRLRLIEYEGTVRQVYYQPGLHFTGFAGWTDPHVAYRVSRKDGTIFSIKPSTEREIWRHIGPIEERFDQCAPKVIREFGKIQEERGKTDMPIMAFGVATSNASFLDMQRGMIRLDSRIADKPEKAGFLAQAVELTEKVASVLQLSLRNMISPQDSKRGDSEIRQYMHRYFSECEKEFYGLEATLAGADRDYKEISKGWQGCIKKIARRTAELVRQNYCYRAADLVRAQKADDWLNRELFKLMKGESRA